MTSVLAAPRTCTVGPRATDQSRCGRPAVTTFTGHDGVTYAECLDHAPTSALRAAALRPGTVVRLRHAGVSKTGSVVAVGRTRVTVEIAVARTGGAKLVERLVEEIELVD